MDFRVHLHVSPSLAPLLYWRNECERLARWRYSLVLVRVPEAASERICSFSRPLIIDTIAASATICIEESCTNQKPCYGAQKEGWQEGQQHISVTRQWDEQATELAEDGRATIVQRGCA